MDSLMLPFSLLLFTLILMILNPEACCNLLLFISLLGMIYAQSIMT